MKEEKNEENEIFKEENENVSMKVRFDSVFRRNPDGSLSPRKTISIAGTIMGRGVSFTEGVKFGDIDIFDYIGNDVEVERVGEILVIRGFYGRER